MPCYFPLFPVSERHPILGAISGEPTHLWLQCARSSELRGLHLAGKSTSVQNGSAPGCTLFQSLKTRRFTLTSPWMSSPYATPTQIIDGVMQTPAPTPIPGLMPLPIGPVGVPPTQVPFLGVPPLPIPPLGVHPAYALGYGVSPLSTPQMGIPPVPFLPFGAQVPSTPFLGEPSLPFSPSLQPPSPSF